MKTNMVPSSDPPPLVSVVIPTYNRAAMLGECLASALRVDWPALEVIVVDDGSTDDTEAVVARCNDGRIRYARIANGGAARARNHGLGMASGEFVQFLDSDDLLLQDKFRVEVPWLHSGYDMVFGDYAFFLDDPERCTKELRGRDAAEDWVAFFLEENTQTAVPLHRRASLSADGAWRLDCLCVDDFEMHLRRAVAGARIAYLPGRRSVVRDHAGERFSANPKGNDVMRRVLVEYGLQLRAAGTLTPARRRALGLRLWRVVQAELQAGRRASAQTAYSALQLLVPRFEPPRTHPLVRPLERLVGPYSLEAYKWSFKILARTLEPS